MATIISPDGQAEGAPYVSPRAQARQLWLKIHRWLGLALMIPMALLGFTGSMQVWPEETAAFINPQREVAATADPATIAADHVAAAQTAMADRGPIAEIEIGEVGEAIVAQSAPYAPPLYGIAGPVSQEVWIDPANAAVLDSAPNAGGFMWYMHFMHEFLLIEGWGLQLVGWMGVFLVISAVTGLVVFWPGTKRFFSALRWQKRAGFALNLHRQSGVLMSLVLIVEAITGAWIVFPGFFAAIIEPGVEQPQRGRGPRGGGGPDGAPIAMPAAAWIAALDTAKATYPGRPTGINAPVDAAGAWQVEIAGGAMDATVTVPLAADGTPSVEERAHRDGPPPPTTRAGAIGLDMRWVHYGRVGGPIWQVLLFLSGWAMTFLALSGIYIWAKRKLRRRA